MTLKYVDLFCGIGGFRQAAELLSKKYGGLDSVAASDIDPFCEKFYKRVFGDSELFIPDVNSITTLDTVNSIEETVELPNFDLLLAGFPCQPFANIGPRSGLNDPRGTLIFKICGILQYYRPKFFILENVQKMRNLDKGKALTEITSRLEAAGYQTHIHDLCASDFGVPQQRRRIFFCGIRKDLARDRVLLPPKPINPNTTKYPTTWHLLERELHEAHIIPCKTRETVLRINPKWQGDIRIDRAISRPITATMAKWHRANQDNYFSERYVYSKFPPERDYSTDATDEDVVRRITPLEGFRLQGFPDQYEKIRLELGYKYTPSYRVIGNAVPVTLAHEVLSNFLNEYG